MVQGSDHDPDDTRLAAGTPGSGGAQDAGAPGTLVPGMFVGPYKLLRYIDEGAMGEVWLAERRDTFRQRVALKLLTASGISPREAIARFDQEREVLASMSHDHVARIFDGGVHGGRPWFAMEFVDGEPITDFCDRRGLGVRERLALFRQVCDAVTHAHRRGIIHRDIKPSNILVGMGTGSVPQAKVIDFGIAKAMSQRLTDHTSITVEHRPIGTYEYMSPEQADPGGQDIDTRTDVYSLGVVLYELLSGVKPFDLEKRAEHEKLRIIREEDAPTPSVRLSTASAKDSGTAERISKSRREEIQHLVRALRSELEWIPLMAIRKDRERRYRDVDELSEDLQRYLDGRALVAAPESAAYRMRKYVRRHRVQVLAVAAVAVALVAGLGTAVWKAKETAQARDAAERLAVSESSARARAESVFEFLVSVLNSGDPMSGGSNGVSVREAMDFAASRLEQGELAADPAASAWIRVAIAQVFLNAGDSDRARALAGPAVEVLDSLGAAHASRRAWAKMTLAAVRLSEGRTDEAERLMREARLLREDLGASGMLDVARTDASLSEVLAQRGDLDEALKLARRAVASIEHLRDSGDVTVPSDLAAAITNLARIHGLRGESAEAERGMRNALSLWEEKLGPNHPMVGRALVNLGIVLELQGRLADSLPMYERALSIYRERLPMEHPSTAVAICTLVQALMAAGDAERASSLAEEAISTIKAHDHPDLDRLAQMVLVRAYTRLSGEGPSVAEPFFAEALEIRRRASAEDRIELAESIYNLASVRLLLGRAGAAMPLAEEALSMLDRLGEQDPELRASFEGLVEECRAAHGGSAR